MRCVTCDKRLTDFEATRRHAMTNEFLDLCNRCVKDIPNLPTKDRTDLSRETDYDDEYSSDDDPSVTDVTDCYNLGVDKD